MPVFNNDPGVKPAPNFAIREQGMRAPTMDVSGFFKGIGDVFSGSATVTDNNNQKDIEDRIRAETEVSNDIVTNGQYSAQTAANAPSDQLPPDLNRSFDRLKTLNNAYTQGKVNEAAYWARLNAVAKELRVKYPNYDSIIDQKFSSITGGVPGNRLRDQLLSDADKRNASLNSVEKERRADMDRWATAGVLHPQYRELYAKGEEGWAKIQDHAYRLQQEDAQKKRILQNWDMQKKSGELQEDDVYRQTNTLIQNHVDNIFKTSFDTVTEGGMKGFLSLINKAKDPNSPGGSAVTDSELQQITTVMAGAKAQVMASVDTILHTADKNFGNASPASYFRDNKRLDDIKKNAMDRIATIEDLVVNKQYGLLVWNKAMSDNMIEGDVYNAQKTNENTRRLMLLRKTMGDQAVNFYLQGHIKELDKAVDVRTLGDSVTAAAVDGKPMTESLSENKASANATKATIGASVGVLTDPKTSAPVRTNVIRSLFGERNNDFLTKFSSGEQAQVYGKLVNPSTSKAIYEASKNDPRLWENYKSWATNSALPAISRGVMKTLDNIEAESGGKVSFEFDGTQFVMKGNDTPADRRYDMGKADMFSASARKPLQDLNSILGAYKSVLEAEGSDVNAGMSDLFTRLHMRPKDQNKDSIWDTLKDGVNNWFHSSFSSSGDNVTQGQKGVTGKLPVAPFPGSSKLSTPEATNNAKGATVTTSKTEASPTTAPIVRANFKPEINEAIDNAAQTHGIDPNILKAFAAIESGGDPQNTTGSYKGLFQLSDSEFNKHGSGYIFNASDNANAAAAKLKNELVQFQAEYGRSATPIDLYMIHQQGVDGYRKHLANPDQAAWLSMSQTGEGRQKGEGWSKKAIWGNVPDGYWKNRFGSVENITSKDFVEMWSSIMDKKMGLPTFNGTAKAPVKEQDPLTVPNDRKVILEFAKKTLGDQGSKLPGKLDDAWYDYWNQLYNAIGKPLRE